MNRETNIWITVIGLLAVASCLALGMRFLWPRPLQLAPPKNGAGESPDRPNKAEGPESLAGASPAPILGTVPAFQLTTQAGRALKSEELAGKVWVANFIFTRCQATCPRQTERMAELQKSLANDSSWPDIRLVSITVDPEHDQPEVLREYATTAGADEKHWSFLTGERDAIWRLSKEGFRLPVEDDSQNAAMPIMHDSKFVLVDRLSRIRGYFDALAPDGLDELRKALAFVLPEMSPPAGESDPETTHLAQPPEIIHNAWLEDRAARQRAEIKSAMVYHDFSFRNVVAESGIDFRPQIVDEQRWRLQVNHYDHGNGIAVADIDGDGLLDIYLVAQVGGNGLYRNLGNGKFENITWSAGVSVPGRIGVSASFADIDNDGDADLFVTTVRGGNLLFENDGKGGFRDITEAAGLGHVGHSSGGVFFDFDRDGLLDLFLTNVGKYSTEEYAALRIDRTSSLPPGEYRYYVGMPDAFAGHLKPALTEKSILYRNVGGKFVDVSREMGLEDEGWSGDATPLDLNGDGWPDLYVLNMQGDDQYYENVGGRRFERKTREYFPRTPWGSMGVKWFDFDNDGRFDLFVTDMHSDMSEDVGPEFEKRKSNMKWPETFLRSTPERSIFGNALFHNRGEGKFAEVSDPMGVENYWPWGLSAADLNADGFDDLFITSSMCFPYRYGVNSVLLNDRGAKFVDAEFVLGVEPRAADRRIKPWFELDCDELDRENPICRGRSGKVTVWSALGSRSSVIFDLDNDGDLDVVTNDFNSEPQVLLSDLAQRLESLRYLKVNLRGVKSNRDGLGAIVTVVAGERRLSKVHDGKSGYLSQSRMPLYFGLGKAEAVDRVEVVWPSGSRQKKEGPIAANQLLEILEEIVEE